TGGEPLLRKDIERLIEQLAMLKTSQGHDIDIALTTNGLLLKQKALALRNAGLSRLTVSLDALDNTLFQRMSDTDHHVEEILEGIAAGEAAGFSPIKINMVVQRSINESQIVPMAQYFKPSGHILRFIEFMDVGNTNGWRASKVVPSSDILAQLHQAMPIEPINQPVYGEVAKRWRYLDGQGEVGAISSVTQAFCHDCTRARLSADGQFFKCLFGQHGIDLRCLVRDGNANDNNLRASIAAQWRLRHDQYSMLRDTQTSPAQHAEMSYLGG
nr:radical SAM protein [Burkholderiaceae bacterium]